MRRQSRAVSIRGGLTIGGGAPVSVQSMTSRPAPDIEGNLEQIRAMHRRGAALVRLALRTVEEADALPAILAGSPLPLCADIHFDYRIALAAIRHGIHKIRLNPGNIGERSRVEEVVRAAKDAGVPIRIGVNGGSVNRKKYPEVTPEALVDSALEHIVILEDLDFTDIVVSIKSSDIAQTVAANRLFADKRDYPLHVGLTEAGYGTKCIIQSSVAIGALLLDGIGDTIRVSMTGDPVREIEIGREILRATGLLSEGVRIISCPTCGRTDPSIDLEAIAENVDRALSLQFADLLARTGRTLTVAVMGCEVNGPGEAAHADIGIAGARSGSFILFSRGKTVRRITAGEVISALTEEAGRILGTDA